MLFYRYPRFSSGSRPGRGNRPAAPASPADDYIRKLYYYKNAGVREYWIVDPRRKTVTVNYFEAGRISVQYSFDSTIRVNICDDLYISFSDIAELLNI